MFVPQVERIIWEGWFSIEIPEGWQFDESGESISIYSENGFGAFTISLLSATDDSAHDRCFLARGFAKQRGWEVSEAAFRLKNRGFESTCSFEYNTAGDGPVDYWLVSAFRTLHRAALLTYTCALPDTPKESSQRDQIVDSFRWEDPRPHLKTH